MRAGHILLLSFLMLISGCRMLHETTTPSESETFVMGRVRLLTQDGYPLQQARVQLYHYVPGDPFYWEESGLTDELGIFEYEYISGREVSLSIWNWGSLAISYPVGTVVVSSAMETVLVDPRSMTVSVRGIPDDADLENSLVRCRCEIQTSLGAVSTEVSSRPGAEPIVDFVVNPGAVCRFVVSITGGAYSMEWTTDDMAHSDSVSIEPPFAQSPVEITVANGSLPTFGLRVSAYSVERASIRATFEVDAGLSQPLWPWLPTGLVSFRITDYNSSAPYLEQTHIRELRLGETLAIDLGAQRLDVLITDSTGQAASFAYLNVEQARQGVRSYRSADATGRYFAYVSEGHYVLNARNSSLDESAERPIFVDSDTSIELQLQPN